MSSRKIRCINYDWIEVYCLESDRLEPRTAGFFRQWFEVSEREYGTPMYREMFVLSHGRQSLIEVRRAPYSCISEGGIFPDNCAHLRLTNYACYLPDPVGFLISFMRRFSFTYVSTRRMDICLDFEHFDNGDDPYNFVRRYHAGKYSKMYQRLFNDHGEDVWSSRRYNSIKFGSYTSPISTKLYDKSLELKEKHDKPYIREAWKNCGLVSECVWRAEFSIYPNFKNLVKVETGESMPVDIMQFRTREQILELFFMLADRYLDFRYIEYVRGCPGRLQRKDRCRRKILFKYDSSYSGYKPFQNPTDKSSFDKTVFKIVDKIGELAESVVDDVTLRALETTASVIIDSYFLDEFQLEWIRERLKRVMTAQFMRLHRERSDLFEPGQ